MRDLGNMTNEEITEDVINAATNNEETEMNFGSAVEELKRGNKVARSGWNGKGMFLFLIDGNCWEFTTDNAGPEINDLDLLPFLCMKTADNKLVPWLASNTDMLADDWGIVL